GRYPFPHVLLHAGERVPADPDPFAHRHAPGRLYSDENRCREGDPSRRRQADLFWQPFLVLQDVIAVHVPGYDPQADGTYKERVYAPQTRAFRYDNEPCFP